jgi:NAD(P)-dependent dehydrogenase (short-subunit alcohol dehydrogenase family)
MVREKRLIVTGAASGIGAAAAKLFAKAGARVVAADRDVSAGKEVVADIVRDGGEAIFVKADIALESDVQDLISSTVDAFGRLDGAFNNAGISRLMIPIHQMTIDQWHENMRINLDGTFLCMKHELAAMLGSGGGTIVNNISCAGTHAFPLAADYVSSKHGVVGLTRCAALDYAANNIRVNAVLPGTIHTPLLKRKCEEDPHLEEYMLKAYPVGRFGRPEEIAHAAMWLLSDNSTFVTGACLVADGGMTLV